MKTQIRPALRLLNNFITLSWRKIYCPILGEYFSSRQAVSDRPCNTANLKATAAAQT